MQPRSPAAARSPRSSTEHTPDLILFPATYDGRDVAGRLQAHHRLRADGERHRRLGVRPRAHRDLRRHADRRRRARGRRRRGSCWCGRGRSRRRRRAAGPPRSARRRRTSRTGSATPRWSTPRGGARPARARGRATVVIAGGRGLGRARRVRDARRARRRDRRRRGRRDSARPSTPAGCRTPTRSGRRARPSSPRSTSPPGISGALQHVVGMKGREAHRRDQQGPRGADPEDGRPGRGRRPRSRSLPALTEEIRRRAGLLSRRAPSPSSGAAAVWLFVRRARPRAALVRARRGPTGRERTTPAARARRELSQVLGPAQALPEGRAGADARRSIFWGFIVLLPTIVEATIAIVDRDGPSVARDTPPGSRSSPTCSPTLVVARRRDRVLDPQGPAARPVPRLAHGARRTGSSS